MCFDIIIISIIKAVNLYGNIMDRGEIYMPFFGIFFVLILIYIIYTNVSRYIKNESSPVINTRAQIIDKKCDSHTHTDANGVMTTSDSYYLIFELDSASTLKLSVSGRIYKKAVFNEWGTLTFQGTRFYKFESAGSLLEK